MVGSARAQPGTLFERELELDQLDALLERGIDEGAIGFVEGEPGIGKTTLLKVGASRAREGGSADPP